MMVWSARFLLVIGVVGVCLACVKTPEPEVAAAPERPANTVLTPTVPRPVPLIPIPGPGFEDEPVDRAPVPEPNPALPAVPAVDGLLEIKVVYPRDNALIMSRDSNFVIGSVGTGRAGLKIDGTLVPVWPNGSFLGWVANPPVNRQYYEIVAYTARDTVRLIHRVRTRAALPPVAAKPPEVTKFASPMPALLGNETLFKTVSDTDHIIIGRPTPTGTYRWFLLPRTVVRVVQYRDDMAQVQLDNKQLAWIARRDVQVIPAGKRPANVTATISKKITIDSAAEWVNINIPVASPPAYQVDQRERGITVTLYNVQSTKSVAPAIAVDPLLANVTLNPSTTRSQIDISLTRPVFGYLVLYDAGIMTIRVRRPPMPDVDSPLRGLTIAVDAGHPPAGATGPTGLYEAVPNLAIARRVSELLKEKGANVVMTRSTDDTVQLGDRPIMARKANAHALVSIHLNAVPDGTHPLRVNGTGTYYFQPHSKQLATFVQQALVPELKLRDLGIIHANLALARPTWMPSILAEGLFLIVPEQEAAVRTPEYQSAYARGVVAGLERYFATLSQ